MDRFLREFQNMPNYPELRFQKELEYYRYSEILRSLEFEFSLYENIPVLLKHNYIDENKFLDYVNVVKNYSADGQTRITTNNLQTV